MGSNRAPEPVKLFVGLLTSRPELVADVGAVLSCEFGHIESKGGPFAFHETNYYDKEMGGPLSRYFFGFSDLIPADSLAGIKIRTNTIEGNWRSGKIPVARPINLDPGYLEEAKLVLASTKNFYHRILLSRGIYAEVTMHYQGGQWQALPWTFPDFRSGRYHVYFTDLRNRYRAQLRQSR